MDFQSTLASLLLGALHNGHPKQVKVSVNVAYWNVDRNCRYYGHQIMWVQWRCPLSSLKVGRRFKHLLSKIRYLEKNKESVNLESRDSWIRLRFCLSVNPNRKLQIFLTNLHTLLEVVVRRGSLCVKTADLSGLYNLPSIFHDVFILLGENWGGGGGGGGRTIKAAWQPRSQGIVPDRRGILGKISKKDGFLIQQTE